MMNYINLSLLLFCTLKQEKLGLAGIFCYPGHFDFWIIQLFAEHECDELWAYYMKQLNYLIVNNIIAYSVFNCFSSRYKGVFNYYISKFFEILTPQLSLVSK